MGCDIHLYIEKKKKGKWVMAQGVVADEDGNLNVPYPDLKYTGRNYELFGFLAGVRNPENQYFETKGFPKNASKEVKNIFKSWGRDAHTPSYLTLAELKEVDWKDRMIKVSGMKQKDQLKKLKKTLKTKNPDYNLLYDYCQWTNQEDYESFEVSIPISFYFKDFYRDVVDKISMYDWRCEKEEIRIVFWFDN
ncbi:hypothetical protein LCGC14_1395480 [marine sediment metagenome]|uniref:Uncharacterized protein n=1 Tax=marine sediment metagenome TaxID=412755 RepID=A0A0F9N072_9ZZZZ